MLKRSLYPKTERYKPNKIRITEKLDGSNLAFFKWNDTLYIAQRNNIFTLEHALNGYQGIYKGLSQWLRDNHTALDLHEGACIIGEWIGMGQIKYSQLDKRFYMFAKANVDEDFNLYNLNYYHENFSWPFVTQFMPECIDVVPIVAEVDSMIDLDELYETYQSESKVEGFIVITNNTIKKYVRFKDGKPSEHRP